MKKKIAPLPSRPRHPRGVRCRPPAKRSRPRPPGSSPGTRRPGRPATPSPGYSSAENSCQEKSIIYKKDWQNECSGYKYGRSNLIHVHLNQRYYVYRCKNGSGMAESVFRIRSHGLLAALRGGGGQGGQPLRHPYIAPRKIPVKRQVLFLKKDW